MRIMRTTLILGLGVLVLPTDAEQRARVYGAATAAIGWSMTFCDRNAETCAQGGRMWNVFVKKAAFGGKLAFDLIQKSSNHLLQPTAQSSKLSEARSTDQVTVDLLRRGTLKQEDHAPPWRGKPALAER